MKDNLEMLTPKVYLSSRPQRPHHKLSIFTISDPLQDFLVVVVSYRLVRSSQSHQPQSYTFVRSGRLQDALPHTNHFRLSMRVSWHLPNPPQKDDSEPLISSNPWPLCPVIIWLKPFSGTCGLRCGDLERTKVLRPSSRPGVLHHKFICY
jgi:hypothetical protein